MHKRKHLMDYNSSSFYFLIPPFNSVTVENSSQFFEICTVGEFVFSVQAD